MHVVSQNPQDTYAIAATLARRILTQLPSANAATVLALHGPLGAGKTTFTQGLAHALGIPTLPKSPTFMLAKQYPIPNTPYSLWHLDCYRMTGHQDLVTIDLHHIFEDAKNIVVIEWPENIGDGLPRDHIAVHLAHAGNDKRSISISES